MELRSEEEEQTDCVQARQPPERHLDRQRSLVPVEKGRGQEEDEPEREMVLLVAIELSKEPLDPDCQPLT